MSTIHESVRVDATFENDKTIVAMVPVRAYSSMWIVVLEHWVEGDGDEGHVAWSSGVLNTYEGSFVEHTRHDELQLALDDLTVGVTAITMLEALISTIKTARGRE